MASITSTFADKKIGIETIVQKEELNEGIVPIVIITDPFLESENAELIKKIDELDSVKKVRSIRIEPF